MCTSPISIFVRPGQSKKDLHIASRGKHKGLVVGARINPYGAAHGYEVPCGKCCECIKRKQNDWAIRMQAEMRDKGVGTFITLTYRDENIPYMIDMETGERWNSLSVRDVQRWIKRFAEQRYREGKDERVRKWTYFLCGEYGPITLRPHYHVIFFGLKPSEMWPALCDWRKRFGYFKYRSVGSSTQDRIKAAKYVAKYANKGVFRSPLEKQGKVLPSFSLMSKGLGISYVEERKAYHLCKLQFDGNIKRYDSSNYHSRYLGYTEVFLSRVADRLCTYMGETKYSLPRYFKNKIIRPQSNLAFALKDFLFDRNVQIREEKCRQLVSSGVASSLVEADYLIIESDLADKRERERLARESLNKFYKRSKF